jgi:hypothetical protein
MVFRDRIFARMGRGKGKGVGARGEWGGDSEAGVATERTDEWEEVERPRSGESGAGARSPEARFVHAI